MSCTFWRLTTGTMIELSATNRELYFFNRFTGESAAIKLNDSGNELVTLNSEFGCKDEVVKSLVFDSSRILPFLEIRKLLEKAQ